jgi:hypothetical protein
MAVEKKPPKVTKKGLIEKHLREKKNLSSNEAINLYGATRLAAVICQLKDEGWVFVEPAKIEEGLDRYNNHSSWARYELVSEPNESAIKKSASKKDKTKDKKLIKPAVELTDVPEDKTVVLRPARYKKGTPPVVEGQMVVDGKTIIQPNLFSNEIQSK